MKQNSISCFEKLILLIVVLLSHSFVQAQTPIQRAAIIRNYDHSKLQAMAKEFAAAARANKQEALALAKIHGWEPIKYNADGTFDELMGVRDDGSPIYYTLYNVAAARSTRTNHLNTGGSLGLDLNGQGMKVYVWDGGPTLPSHQEFNDQVNPGRVIINDGVTTLNWDSWHAQHVTGTILAAGVQPNAKGMAPLAQAFTHEWNNDLAEATKAAGEGMLLSNHSYGENVAFVESQYFGAYEDRARVWDELMYNAPAYLPVFAAGNSGDYFGNNAPLGGNRDFDKLSGWQTAKNHLVVANANDVSVAADGSLTAGVSIYFTSSQGPTDDFRIKPDITGNGAGVFSTDVYNDAGYRSASGTSMAAPNVTGSLLLLQQHYNNLNGSFMRAATLKGLALHTADDAGMAGPDAIFGWGLLNAKAAAQEITGNGATSIISELTLTPGQSYSLPVEADGVNDLIASISWTDPPGTVMQVITPNNSTPILVNDLDIRVTQASSTFLPYRLTGVDTNDQGDNIVDPYERVDVKGASGSYIVTVTHKGSLSGGSQNYSLIVTGVNTGCALTPANFNLSTVGWSTSTISWDANPNATYDIRYRKSGSANWTTVSSSGASSFELNGLESSTQYEAQVRSKCQSNSVSAYTASVFFTTTENPGFITVWQTTEANEKITIPTNSSRGTYNYTVDWGDGTINTNQTGDATHEYSSPGEHVVKITGDFPHIHFNGREGSDKIKAVEQWGNIRWKSMVGAFKGCSNLEITATDTPDLSQVASMSEMFSGATSFNQDIGGWDVSNVIDMHAMFHGATAFNQEINNWDVSNVKIMRNMFWKATSFNQDIGSWDVRNVIFMTWMFEEATAFNRDISDWNVSNSTSMLGMFSGATSFNQDISRWDMSNVESTTSMFEGATSFNQDISSWNMSNVIYMTRMFKGATSFNRNLGKWTSNATERGFMFDNSGLDCSNYSATLIGWANHTDTEHVSLGAVGLEYGTNASDAITTLNDRGWNIVGHTGAGGGCLLFTINAIADVTIDENTEYTGPVPSLSGYAPVGNVTYTLGGTDADWFTINPNTGRVSMEPRDYETPEDANADNVYELSITATDDHNNSDSERWRVTVLDVNEVATFTINAIADVTIDENTGYTGPAPALSGDIPIGNITYTLGGTDDDWFTIDPKTGRVSMEARDFEAPKDANSDNIYELSITATDDDVNSASESWRVTIENVNELVTGTVTPPNAGKARVYPNPVKKQLNIVLDPNHGKIQQMVVRMISGQVLKRIMVLESDLTDEGVLSVDLSHLATGLYLLEVQGIGTGSVFRTKFFKQ